MHDGWRIALAVALVAASAGLAGCLGEESPPDDGDDEAPGPPSEGEPPGQLPERIGGLEHLGAVPNEDAKDVEVRGSIAYVGAASGLFTVNLTDPAEPEVLGTARDAPSRYVELVPYEDRLVAAASGVQQDVLHLVDVTDPEAPERITSFDPGRNVHGTDRVPGTHLLYNPRGVGDPVDSGIDVIDVADPENPEVAERWSFPPVASGQPVETPGCAMLRFTEGSDTAWCPGVTQTYALDVADPLAPELVGVISNPAIEVHHWVAPFADGDRIFLADWAGAANAQACSGSPDGQASGPTAAVWVYDVSDPSDPQPTGAVSAPPPEDLQEGASCSAHVLERVGDRPVAAVAWHHGGAVLVEASDPAQPTVVDRWAAGQDVWSLATWGPFVVTGSQNAGVDVLAVTGE